MPNLASLRMQSTIASILKAHRLFTDFTTCEEFHVKIEHSPYMPLTIERHGPQVIVAHYFKQNGDLVPDPDMEFELGPDSLWYPVAIQFAIGTYRRCFYETPSGQSVINQRERLGQRRFSDMWARNLNAQGFDKGSPQKR